MAKDLDLNTTRCVSMSCAFIPSMSIVTKLVNKYHENVKFVHTDKRTDGQTDNGKRICSRSFDAGAMKKSGEQYRRHSNECSVNTGTKFTVLLSLSRQKMRLNCSAFNCIF